MTNDTMSAEEIVRALRTCNNPKGHRCSECPVFSRYEYRICKATVDRQAADRIESQATEIAELRERLSKIDNIAIGYMEDGPYDGYVRCSEAGKALAIKAMKLAELGPQEAGEGERDG